MGSRGGLRGDLRSGRDSYLHLPNGLGRGEFVAKAAVGLSCNDSEVTAVVALLATTIHDRSLLDSSAL